MIIVYLQCACIFKNEEEQPFAILKRSVGKSEGFSPTNNSFL